MIDSFVDGNSLVSNFKISDYGKLCRCKNTNIILGHFGWADNCIPMGVDGKGRIEGFIFKFCIYTLIFYDLNNKRLNFCIKSLKGLK